MDGDRHVGGRTLARHLGSWRGEGSGVAYAELADRITLLVLDGRLPTSTRLPAERELATALELSRTTVAAAYDQLRQAGFLHSRRGSGSWTTLPERRADTDMSPFAPTGDDSALDLAYASPPAPEAALSEALAHAVEELPRYSAQSGYRLLGLEPLRAAVAGRFTARGLPTTPDQVLITCGAQHAITLVLATLAQPGDRVLVEHPTYPNVLDAIAQARARAVPVGFAGAGWDLETMAAAVRDACPRFVYLIPDFHNPTGRSMSPAQRLEILELCRRTRTPLVIDETMSEVALDGDPPPPLAGLAAGQGGVPLITVGSASKTFWGGLRIGWVRARRPVIDRIARVRASMDIASSVVDQLTVEHLVTHIGPVLEQRRRELRSARDHLVELVGRQLPGWRAPVPPGGLSLWVDLGAPVSSALVAAAGRHGVQLAAGPRFGLDGAFERNLRLPYTLPEPKLSLAVQRLVAAWRALPEQPAAPRWEPDPAEVA
ncbi:MAG TPA: PLP-dependent aminotransferase family protein [Pseudonocardia sp.]|jgi:hypothetical protein